MGWTLQESGFESCTDRKLFHPIECLHWLWVPPSLISNMGWQLTHRLHLLPILRISGVVYPLPHTFSWCDTKLIKKVTSPFLLSIPSWVGQLTSSKPSEQSCWPSHCQCNGMHVLSLSHLKHKYEPDSFWLASKERGHDQVTLMY